MQVSGTRKCVGQVSETGESGTSMQVGETGKCVEQVSETRKCVGQVSGTCLATEQVSEIGNRK